MARNTDGTYSRIKIVQYNNQTIDKIIYKGSCVFKSMYISIKYKILISGVRSANNYVQLSEINFYDSDSKKIDLTGAGISANTNGNPLSYPNNTETEINLTDNNPETKLCALWKNNNLTILLTTDTEISFFSYTTANDEPNRDPVSWQIYKSVDNGLNWELIQTVTNADITSSRKTETQLFPFY